MSILRLGNTRLRATILLGDYFCTWMRLVLALERELERNAEISYQHLLNILAMHSTDCNTQHHVTARAVSHSAGGTASQCHVQISRRSERT
jgi:hypothetical protein